MIENDTILKLEYFLICWIFCQPKKNVLFYVYFDKVLSHW